MLFFPFYVTLMCKTYCVKVSKYGVFSGPYFPAFGLNTERYGVSFRIQSKCRKLRTRKNPVFGHFSRCDNYLVTSYSCSNAHPLQWH